MRPDGHGRALVTGGPFTESAEQIVGFHLVETDDEVDLRAACERFAGRGELIELRRWPAEGEPHGDRPSPTSASEHGLLVEPTQLVRVADRVHP